MQEQRDAKFLEVFAASVTKADNALRRKILAVRQRLRTEHLDKGLLACMPPAERIASALVFNQLDVEKAQRLLRANGAGLALLACMPYAPPGSHYPEAPCRQSLHRACECIRIAANPEQLRACAGMLPPFEQLYKSSTSLAPSNTPSSSDCNNHGACCSHAADTNAHGGPSAPPLQPPAPSVLVFDPGAASTSQCPPPDSSQTYSFAPEPQPRSQEDANHACDASMHESEGYGADAAQNFHPVSSAAMDACDVVGPSHASTGHGMHTTDDRSDSSASPDFMEVGGGELSGPLQQLRARLVQPPPDDTLSALLIFTNGDVPESLKLLSESGMQLLPDPSEVDTSTHAGPSGQSCVPSHGENTDHSNNHTQEEEAPQLVWLWRARPLAYWVAGEVVEVAMSDGEPRLTVKTKKGVIGDVEQGLLWPRGRGKAPPPPLDDDVEPDMKGAAEEKRGSGGAQAGMEGERTWERRQSAGAQVVGGEPAPCPVLMIQLPPEGPDDNLSG